MPTFGELVGGLMVIAAMGTVAYLAIMGNSEQALGALIAVVAGGVSYFLRAKVQTPNP